jgi:hypothetical protein
MRFAVPKPPQPDGRAARTSGSAKRGIERTGVAEPPARAAGCPICNINSGCPGFGAPTDRSVRWKSRFGDRGSHDPIPSHGLLPGNAPLSRNWSGQVRLVGYRPRQKPGAMRAGEPLILTPMRDPPDRPSRLALGGDGADDRSGTSATQRQSRYGPRGQPQWADWTGTPRLSGRRNAPDARQAPLTTR